MIREQSEGSPLSGRLELVQKMVVFAESEFGLPAEGAYQDYVDLQRPYVVWNVLAAPEFSLEARTWWYPLVGSLEYRGYFEKELADREADRFRQRGDDVFVGGVAAYSTLGWFDDPVLNTFVDDPESKLAELLFHELAHRRLFFSGDTACSEAFATAVGREGVRRWFLAKNDAQAMERFRRQRERDDQVIALILRKRDELEQLYREHAVSLLLRAGADPTIPGWMGVSAVDQAWYDIEFDHATIKEIRGLLRSSPSSLRDRVHEQKGAGRRRLPRCRTES